MNGQFAFEDKLSWAGFISFFFEGGGGTFNIVILASLQVKLKID